MLNLAKQQQPFCLSRAWDSKPAIRSQAVVVATCSLVCVESELKDKSIIAFNSHGEELAVVSPL